MRGKKDISIGILLLLLSGPGLLFARKPRLPAPFKFAGGTEDLPRACSGLIEVGQETLIFKCARDSVSIPYAEIVLMQYRPDISQKVRNMEIKWKERPRGIIPFKGGRTNRYFTIIYQEQGTTRAVVLNAPPQTMRPYLAEIEVKAGKRVEVEENEQYD